MSEITSLAAESSTSYDVVPYQSHAFAQSQPDKLATVARLFGLEPVLPSKARVLELGCASGGNLIPLAARFPEARFLGIDLSEVEVQHGREQVAALGLTNIRIERQSITEFKSDERFDYIIAHGVYSWVPEPVQAAIMALCRDHLSEDGVAYISYNVYPGWKSREVVRDAMMFHAGSQPDPKTKLQQARGFIQYIEKITDPKSAYGALMRDEAKIVGNAPDYYLFHDHLEENNRPCYFKDFIARAMEHGLGFLGEASVAEMAPQRLGKDVFETLNKLGAGNVIATEQYMDFFKNRMFRQTLLVHEKKLSKVSRAMNIAKLLPFCASSAVQVVKAPGAAGAECEFQIGPNAKIKTVSSLISTFMLELATSFPRPVPLAAMRERAMRASTNNGGPVTLLAVDNQALKPLAELDDLIVRMLIDGLLTLHTEAFEVGRADAATPRAFSVALNLVRRKQTRVPNLRHESITLSPVEAEVLALMDGQTDRQRLLEGLLVKSHAGDIRVERDKQLVKDEAVLRPLVENLLNQSLKKFERCALLS